MLARATVAWMLFSTLGFASLAEEPKESKLKPTLIFSGSHTAIDRELFTVVADEAAWKALWEKHRGGVKTLRFTEREQSFDIDFESQYVVAIFTPDCDACDVTTRRRGNEVVIGFRATVYGIKGRVPGAEDKRTEHEKAKKDAVTPYAFVVLPKPVSTVVIEQDVRRDKFGAAVWQERKRFPASTDRK